MTTDLIGKLGGRWPFRREFVGNHCGDQSGERYKAEHQDD
jgi:hypothetical protein